LALGRELDGFLLMLLGLLLWGIAPHRCFEMIFRISFKIQWYGDVEKTSWWFQKNYHFFGEDSHFDYPLKV